MLAVHLRVGRLLGVVPQALESAFKLARESSDLPDCRLVVQQTPIVVTCARCGMQSETESADLLRCAFCGAPGGEVASGGPLLAIGERRKQWSLST